MFLHELLIFSFSKFTLTMVRIPSFDKGIKISKSTSNPQLENQKKRTYWIWKFNPFIFSICSLRPGAGQRWVHTFLIVIVPFVLTKEQWFRRKNDRSQERRPALELGEFLICWNRLFHSIPFSSFPKKNDNFPGMKCKKNLFLCWNI